MSTEWGHPINALEFQLRKAEELLPDFKEAAEAAQLRYDDHVAKLNAHKSALELLKRAAEAEGQEVDYSPADGQQEARKQPRFRVGQKVEVAYTDDPRGWVAKGTVGTVEEIDPGSTVKDGRWYSVRFPEHGALTMRAGRLTLWEPPRNSAGIPLIVGNKYQLDRPGNHAQHGRMVQLREELTNKPGQWHVEFVDSKTDGVAGGDELK